MKPGRTGLGRILHAFVYSWQGLRYAFRAEAAFRQEVVTALVLAPLTPFVATDVSHAAVLLGSLLFVLIVELLNSAVEAVVDRHGPELHDLAGAAKDMGSAAVLLSFLVAGLVWGAALWQWLATRIA